MQILVVCAHPDDEVLGAGGTIARHAMEGDEIEVAVLATGVTSRGGDTATLARQLDVLRASARRASALMGVRALHLGDFEDQGMDAVRLLHVVREVESHIRRVRPQTVYTHHHGDLNADHRVTYQAVLTAARPTADLSVRRILSFEVASSTEWNVPYTFAPTVFVDISATIETKFAALEAYDAETRPFPHPRSREALTAIARRWGSVGGLERAEAFQLVREIR
ncbi:MAG: PIG-L deacetylase family protein [Gemmatimonadaceae bacterium]